MHTNSLLAFMEEKAELGSRALAVLGCVRQHGPQTDRQIMERLGYSEPNAVRPRCTELVKKGMLVEKENVRCPVTGKRVRVLGVAL